MQALPSPTPSRYLEDLFLRLLVVVDVRPKRDEVSSSNS